ncbi:MAG: hypothetical protein EKK59_08590 [Neisseriaceae bacterium]|nr:MAG: hypothetical protein EKK59_08590 [Neisseriaceae bacterium]
MVNKEITEGHARALLMLTDRPQERDTLFKEIVLKKTSVRMVEQMARRIAQDKIRKHDKTPEMMEIEKNLTETLGTRVLIENRPNGGRVLIEFFSPEDLTHIANMLAAREAERAGLTAAPAVAAALPMSVEAAEQAAAVVPEVFAPELYPNTTQLPSVVAESIPAELDDELVSVEAPLPTPEEDDLYSVSGFTV